MNADSIDNIKKINDEKTIIYVSNTIITEHNTQTDTISPILPINETIVDWTAINDDIWLIDEKSIIKTSDTKKTITEEGTILEKIAYTQNPYIFIETKKGNLVAFHTGRRQFFSIEGEKLTTLDHVLGNFRNKIWWWNDFEIGFIDLQTLKNTILFRTSDKIMNVLNYKKNTDIDILFIANKNSVQAFDILSINEKRITPIINLDAIDDISLNVSPDSLNIIISDESNNYRIMNYALD